MTDWKKEIELRLDSSKIYSILVEKVNDGGDAISGQQLNLIYQCVEYAYQKSKLILKYMPEYTLHDGEHLFRVLYLMEKIIPEENIKRLSVPELMLLILTAFFHDIGMAPYEKEIRAWRQDWKNEAPDEAESIEFEKFDRFVNTYPEKVEELNKLETQGKIAKAELIRSYLIAEYIRSTHAERARELISRDWKGKILYEEQDLTSPFAELCFSHNEDAMKLLEMDSSLLCGENVVLNLPFIGIVLRLADLLDFDGKRTPSVLFSHLAVRNPVSLTEWQKHRSIRAWTIEPNKIVFSAICKHPAIEASVRKFCDIIDDELKNCNVILSKLNLDQKYRLELPTQVDRDKIHAERDIATGDPIYIYRDTSFELSKRQVVDLLMGTKLYGKPEVALRELLQNSIDACILSKALHKNWNIPYEPKIIVKYYSSNGDDYLEVNDNGIGMNQEIVDKYYSKIGSSYYKSRDFFDLKAQSELSFEPISRFGIGILSCFMVADSIEVETKRLKDQYEYDQPLNILIEGYDSIFTILKSSKKEPGTSTRLLLRETSNPWDKLNDDEFVIAVKDAISKPEIPIEIITDKEKISYTNEDFYKVDANILKDFYWREDENITEVRFNIKESGYEGNVIVGLIEKNGLPVEVIDKLSKKVEIEDEDYELSMAIKYSDNEIIKTSTTIDIDDDGNLSSSTQSTVLAKSKSQFSIHGISFSGELYPSYYNRGKKALIKWPFPILMVLDVGGSNDLDLNSARNEIIFNEKWDSFEQKLAQLICKGLKAKLEPNQWEAFQTIIAGKCKSQNFMEGLKGLED